MLQCFYALPVQKNYLCICLYGRLTITGGAWAAYQGVSVVRWPACRQTVTGLEGGTTGDKEDCPSHQYS